MLVVRNARVPASLLPTALVPSAIDAVEPHVACDIAIRGGTIASVAPAGSVTEFGASSIDLEGSLVFPAFIDCHTHLDKTHTWFRAPNRSGTFLDALETLHKDRVRWTADDLSIRANFALRSAWAHGTRVLRTHVDTALPWAETSHAVMAGLRDRWAGLVEVQTVPLCGMDAFLTKEGEEIADLSIRYGASALGGFARESNGLAPKLKRLLAVATERKIGLDLHIDETGDAGAECLRSVAEAILEAEFPYQVNCGHCCSLAKQQADRQKSTIDLVKVAGIGIISLPMCNLYLQDRTQNTFPKTPFWRGITLVRDFLAAGVPVACASDNVRDAFFAYGDYDMADVYSQSVRLAHLDEILSESVRTVTSYPAKMTGFDKLGKIEAGADAFLVILQAKSFSDLLGRPAAPRRRLDGENLHSPLVPEYEELESLLGG